MQPLYTDAEFKAAKTLDKLPLECKQCHGKFHVLKHDILSHLKGQKKRPFSFCSTKCSRANEDPPITWQCDRCGKKFQRKQSQANRSKSGKHFCSQSCGAKWNNAHKTKGTRVSKLERWLQEQLPLLFPGLEFHFNRTDAINAELDIFVPSLRLAFELNGIFHYEPIYGPEKLGRIQNNDERKVLACAEHSIGLCVIDVSSVKYFKPIKAQKFLDIVANLIRTKLPGDLPASSPLPSQNHIEVP
jgi:hypothetical protein